MRKTMKQYARVVAMADLTGSVGAETGQKQTGDTEGNLVQR
ncbi:MAG: hypothetical protein Q4A71_04230 [Actinomycetaceae bacterium]|nr:hypothetical protein [Actinomycetaceae bacterium]